MPLLSSAEPVHNPIVNLSGYRFVPLDNLAAWQQALQSALSEIGLKGTVLLAGEGINVSLAGTRTQTRHVRQWFDTCPEFRALWLKESRSDSVPFAKLKVKVRREIISFPETFAGESDMHAPSRPIAPTLPPATLRRWLDEARDFVLLDTRNGYEVASGSFEQAEHLAIDSFREFPAAVRHAVEHGRLDPQRPVVTFCTGGVRCEKAAPWMKANGFREVWQVEGGLLHYFAECAGKHFAGHCFVFDDRVEIDMHQSPTGAQLCPRCHHAKTPDGACSCSAATHSEPASTSAIDTV